MDAHQRQRRELLVRALTSGLFMTAAGGLSMSAWSMGKISLQLPPGKSIYDLSGTVTIDGKQATPDTPITTSSKISTGNDGKLIFAVGKDAFILRNNSVLVLDGNLAVRTLRLVTGKLLSVFGRREVNEKLEVRTLVATIGIRGTGMYVESEADRSYVCTCYGSSELVSNDDPLSNERITTTHHDTPRYIIADAAEGKKIQQADVINHTDDELDLIEALVGRTTPFDPGEY